MHRLSLRWVITASCLLCSANGLLRCFANVHQLTECYRMEYAKCDEFIDSESSLVTQAKKFIHTGVMKGHFVVWWICFLVVCLFCWKVLDIWSIVIQLDKFLSDRMLIPSNVQMEPSTLMKVGSTSVNVLNARRDTIVSQKAWKKRWIPCFFATNGLHFLCRSVEVLSWYHLL